MALTKRRLQIDFQEARGNVLVEMVGYGATICTIAAFAPQLVKAWRTRSTNDISLTMFLVRVTGIGLWLT
jgi:MtN3 and saliva related transmembrane protein